MQGDVQGRSDKLLIAFVFNFRDTSLRLDVTLRNRWMAL